MPIRVTEWRSRTHQRTICGTRFPVGGGRKREPGAGDWRRAPSRLAGAVGSPAGASSSVRVVPSIMPINAYRVKDQLIASDEATCQRGQPGGRHPNSGVSGASPPRLTSRRGSRATSAASTGFPLSWLRPDAARVWRTRSVEGTATREDKPSLYREIRQRNHVKDTQRPFCRACTYVAAGTGRNEPAALPLAHHRANGG